MPSLKMSQIARFKLPKSRPKHRSRLRRQIWVRPPRSPRPFRRSSLSRRPNAGAPVAAAPALAFALLALLAASTLAVFAWEPYTTPNIRAAQTAAVSLGHSAVDLRQAAVGLIFTATPTVTSTATATPTFTTTPTSTASPTASPTSTHTATFTPTETPTAVPSDTPTATPPPSDTPTPAPTLAPTAEATTVVKPAKRPKPQKVAGPEGRPSIVGPGENWIDVDLSSQMTYAMVGDQVSNSFLVSTGLWPNLTVTGVYRIYVKYRSADMYGADYYLSGVPYIMYFYKGYGLHGTFWHSNFGNPMSHGCINLRPTDAGWLFDFAQVGTVVSIHP